METITLTETGCYLDNHRGHYITRDAIQLAVDHGFIVGGFEQFALDMYDECSNDKEYPFEELVDLCDAAVGWLNSGQGVCVNCNGAGKVIVGVGPNVSGVPEICRECSGSGRGPRIDGQNFPPIVPDGHVWEFNDGDFGLYALTCELCDDALDGGSDVHCAEHAGEDA